MADKANGVQPVAWLKRNGRVFVDSAHTVRTHAERSAENDKGAEVVPLVLASDYEHLEAKLEAAERDAARYRWLRDRLDSVDWFYGDPPRSMLMFHIPSNMRVSANLDSTIDGEMKP